MKAMKPCRTSDAGSLVIAELERLRDLYESGRRTYPKASRPILKAKQEAIETAIESVRRVMGKPKVAVDGSAT